MSEPRARPEDPAPGPAAGQPSPAAWRPSGPLVFFFAAALSFALLCVVRGWSFWGYLGITATLLVAALLLAVLRRRQFHPIAFALGWLAPPVGFTILFLWITGALGDFVFESRFDADVWRAQAGANWDDRTRLRMVEDLRASGRLDRLTRAEAIALLGEPLEHPGPSSDECVWLVGPGPMIDFTYLRLRIGPDGRVIRHELFYS